MSAATIIAVTQGANAQDLSNALPRRSVTRELVVGARPMSGIELSRVDAMTVDRTGRMFVLDGAEQRIYVVAPRGDLIRTLGRRGGGPGEFEDARWLSLLRDTLWVVDVVANRVTAFATSGDFGATSFLVTPTITGRSFTAVVGIVDGGFITGGRPPSALGFVQDAFALWFATRGGASLNVIATTPVRSSAPFLFLSYTNARGTGRALAKTQSFQPFADAPISSVGSDGKGVWLLQRPSVVTETRAALVLLELSLRGDTLRRRPLTYDPVPITDADFNRVIDSIARPQKVPDYPTLFPDRQMIADSVVRPRFWQPVSSMLMGGDGSIWLRMNGRPPQQNSYWLLTSEGVPESIVTFPVGFVLLSANRNQAWGWRADANGVPMIERYRIGG